MWPPVTVTESKPLLSTPASSPVPSITWPSRSIVMSLAPTIRPWPGQSIRSLVRRMLVVTNSPQAPGTASGGSVTRHDQLAGVTATLPSVSIARTWNVCVPTDGPDVARGRAVDVAGRVDRAHLEVVRADREALEDRRRGARRERLGLGRAGDRALEGDVGRIVGAGEAEQRRVAGARVRRALGDLRVRRDHVAADRRGGPPP